MNGKNASKQKLAKRRLVKKVSKKVKYPLMMETPKAEYDSREDPKDRKSENNGNGDADANNEDSDELVFALL